MTNSKIIPTLGYNHLEIGAPGNIQTHRICGARTRNEATVNELCQLPAGWGTDHPGAGRCKLHGGSRNPGRYSELWRGRMAQIARAALEQEVDNDPLDLLAELEVQRVLLATLIDQLQPGAALPALMDHDHQDDQPAAYKMSRTEQVIREEIARPPVTSRNKKRMLASQDSMGGDGGVVNKSSKGSSVDIPPTEFLTKVNPDNLSVVIDSFGTLSGDEREAVYLQLVEQVRIQVNDIVTTVSKIVSMRNQTAITRSEVAYLVMLLREGMERFVPKENREPYVNWILENIPGMGGKADG